MVLDKLSRHLAGAVFVAVVAHASGCSNEPSPSATAGAASSADKAFETARRGDDEQEEDPVSTSRSDFSQSSVGVAQQHLSAMVSGYKWDPLTPGIASNEQDAAWLNERGYPDSEVYTRLSNLSIEELKVLASSGNKSAQSIYAYKLANSGGSSAEVQTLLMQSAANGSTYALKMAGDIYQTVPSFRDPVMASAYYGVLASEGDQSGFVQGYIASQGMSGDDRLRSRAIEENLRASLISSRPVTARGSQGAASQRPGYKEFLEAAVQSGNGGRK